MIEWLKDNKSVLVHIGFIVIWGLVVAISVVRNYENDFAFVMLYVCYTVEKCGLIYSIIEKR